MKKSRNNDEGISVVCRAMDRDARIMALDKLRRKEWEQTASKVVQKSIKEFNIIGVEEPQNPEEYQDCQLSGADSGSSYKIMDS